jgi:hypothetical protein
LFDDRVKEFRKKRRVTRDVERILQDSFEFIKVITIKVLIFFGEEVGQSTLNIVILEVVYTLTSVAYYRIE